MLEPVGHHTKELVTGRVAQGVVDLFETVEVDQEHSGVPASAVRGQK
jgi:hypothetical protein